MKLFSIAKDGGPESHVTGFFLVEIKSLFSVVILKFSKGTREAYHSHAFNAWTLWLKGDVLEEFPDFTPTHWGAGEWKYTPKEFFHRTRALVDSYAISIRGPWDPTWQEYLENEDKYTTFTDGRKVVAVSRKNQRG